MCISRIVGVVGKISEGILSAIHHYTNSSLFAVLGTVAIFSYEACDLVNSLAVMNVDTEVKDWIDNGISYQPPELEYASLKARATLILDEGFIPSKERVVQAYAKALAFYHKVEQAS